MSDRLAGSALGERRDPPVRRAYSSLPDGSQVHYRWCAPAGKGPDAGDPKTIILVHQVSSSSRMYEPIMPRLANAGFVVLAPDVPGFGESDPPTGPMKVSDYGSVLVDFLDSLHATAPVSLFGHHSGARYVLDVATSYPSRVHRLILSGIPFHDNQPDAASPAWIENRLRTRNIRPVVPEEDGSHLIREWRRVRALDPQAPLEVVHREFVDTMKAHRYDEAYRTSFAQLTGPNLAALRVPCVVIAPSRDMLFEEQEGAVSLIPGGQLRVISGAGVFVIDGSEDEVSSTIIDFFSGPRA